MKGNTFKKYRKSHTKTVRIIFPYLKNLQLNIITFPLFKLLVVRVY